MRILLTILVTMFGDAIMFMPCTETVMMAVAICIKGHKMVILKQSLAYSLLLQDLFLLIGQFWLLAQAWEEM